MSVTRLLTGIVSALIALELLCRLLPVSTSTGTGYHFNPDIVTYPAHYDFVLSSGWSLHNVQHLHSNNFGFIDGRDFVRDPTAIALIGDSFVEANMLPAQQRPAPQLESRLGGRAVYALGGPGSSLLDYVERVKFAQDHFDIRTFVIVIERSDVRQTLCGSGNVHSPCLDPSSLALRHERQAPTGRVKDLVRHSALAQYLFSQLRLKPDQLLAQLFPPRNTHQAKDDTPPEDRIDDATAQIIIQRFLNDLPRNAGQRYILVFDSERDAIEHDVKRISRVRQQFMQAAAEAHMDIVDTAPFFIAYHARSPLNLEVGPSDGHWSPVAISMVMGAVAPKLRTP
ncbi:MAG: hypothetical protein JWN23_3169 [Rhodocyclales bacterium]|nr:hypothetical protein [Rhodocyclales bacterium]